jgi:glucokinase
MSIKNLYIPRRTKPGEKGITVLAGDIGGTKTNLAFYQATESGLKALQNGRYPSAEYSSCTAILQQFLSDNNIPKPDRICLGVAGPVLNGKVELTNLNWDIDIQKVKSIMGVEAVFLLNDLESMAYGLAGLTEEDFITMPPAPVWARQVCTGMARTIFLSLQKAVMLILPHVPMWTLPC